MKHPAWRAQRVVIAQAFTKPRRTRRAEAPGAEILVDFDEFTGEAVLGAGNPETDLRVTLVPEAAPPIVRASEQLRERRWPSLKGMSHSAS